MSYTPTTWATGDTITAAKLNNMEQGIANAGSGYDAVIRLTHADNSRDDNQTNLTPTIVSGTFAGLHAKILGGGCPSILIEYFHPWGKAFSTPLIGEVWLDTSSIRVIIGWFNPTLVSWSVLPLLWMFNDSLTWL